MKIKLVSLIVAALGAAIAIGMYVSRETNRSPSTGGEANVLAGPLDVSANDSEPGTSTRLAVRREQPVTEPSSPTPAEEAQNLATAPLPGGPSGMIFEQAISTLTYPEASFQQKQSAWSQLRSMGKLDQAIRELEERMAANPAAPELPATLGQAYLQKAGAISDIREQGILGMKADQSFEASLNLDPSNWEAHFWKATAMSYWPPQLGKGKEVIEHCMELLKQQEIRPPRPEFAQTYVLLGEQYQREGQPEYAQEVWKRGLGLFPQDTALNEKISGSNNSAQ